MKSFVYCLRDLHFLKIFILCCRLCSEQHPFWFGDKNLVMLLELEGPLFLIKDIFIWAACLRYANTLFDHYVIRYICQDFSGFNDVGFAFLLSKHIFRKLLTFQVLVWVVQSAIT